MSTPPRGLPELPVGLPSEVLVRRPDVRQAEQQLIAANANIGAARAAFFPRITLTGSAGLASGHLSDLFKSGASAWSFAPQLLQPIFDAGRNQGNLRARAGQPRHRRGAVRARDPDGLPRGGRCAGRPRHAGRAAARAAARRPRPSSVRSRLADLRYRNGAASYLEVLDAQRSLFAAQQALVQVQAQSAQNAVALYKVLGGGWRDDDTNR